MGTSPLFAVLHLWENVLHIHKNKHAAIAACLLTLSPHSGPALNPMQGTGHPAAVRGNTDSFAHHSLHFSS